MRNFGLLFLLLFVISGCMETYGQEVIIAKKKAGCTGSGQAGESSQDNSHDPGSWESVTEYTATSSFCAKYFHAYISQSSEGSSAVGLYDSSYNLLAHCDITGQVVGTWGNCQLSTEVQITNGLSYHLFIDDSTGNLNSQYWNGRACNHDRDNDAAYSDPPDPWDTAGDVQDNECYTLVVSDTSSDPT